MSLSRREFIWSAAASAVGLASPSPLLLHAQSLDGQPSGIFRHGVASGDPLADRVVLWTRVTPSEGRANAVIDVAWRIATDPALTQVAARGDVRTSAERDFTVKVDAGGLQPGRTYYYAFQVDGDRSAVGRTKTLPGATGRVRLATVSCSNYPSGFFNVYRCVANRPDLDAVVHLGDYIYEFENGRYGDGSSLLRIPEPPREAVTLSDYRIRYATYRTDPDLQEVHRQHPFIPVWDDHEVANDAWREGAANHNPDLGEGDFAIRKAAAHRAYFEWMPIREPAGGGTRIYRSFRFGNLVDLLMLDTRGLRDRQADATDVAALEDPSRSLLGGPQEAWLFDELRASQRAGTGWRVLGQQVFFAPLMPPGQRALSGDTWDGYRAARNRVLDCLTADQVKDVAVLTGDIHSSWALDVPRNPYAGYDGSTGTGSLAVELVAPAVSSPPFFTKPGVKEQAVFFQKLAPHLKFLDGDNRGYVVVDITAKQLQAEWYFVPTVLERSAAETRAAAFVCERGSSRLLTM